MTGKTLGYDETGSGEVLLLVHGFPLDRTMWEGQLKGLADLRRVVAVDLRGRGKSAATSESSESWSIDDLADDVAATIDSLGVDQVDLAGLSMGGYIVFSLIRRYPEKVRTLILLDTKSVGDTPEAKEGREKTAAQTREQGTAPLIEGLLPKLLREEPATDVKKKATAMFEATSGETAAADALAMRDRADYTSDLAGIKIPVLVLHGEQDQLMPSAGAREMASRIPGSKYVGIPNAGHLCPLENPEAVNRAIREFLGP